MMRILAAASTETPPLDDVLVMSAAALGARLVLGFVPRLRLPGPVLEILAGVLIGPQVLALARVDGPVRLLSSLGLAFLLFLAGMEVDVRALAGRAGREAVLAFGASVLLALAIGFTLEGSGLVINGLLVGIALAASSLGVLIPLLADEGELRSALGRFVIAGASIGEVGAIVLLSLFFSGGSGPGGTLLVLGLFALFALLAAVGFGRAGASRALQRVLSRLQDSSAQIRVRFAVVLLIASVVLTSGLGLEAILGAFAAGAILSLVDRDVEETHPLFHPKLEAIGYGFLVPVFFVASGARLDVDALLNDSETALKVAVFAAALLFVRGAPLACFPIRLDRTRRVVAGLLEAGSLPLLVTAAAIGTSTRQMTTSTATALVIAGLVATVVYPTVALVLLRRLDPDPVPDPITPAERNPEET